MDEELRYLLDQVMARQPRQSTLSEREQQLIRQAIADMKAGIGVQYRQRGQLEREYLERHLGGQQQTTA